ncbi:efflux RND transporter periplasmic adaptor subunit [Rubrivirga litoralis]|uniref:Efflux RND transporter periplasmic adaptor subunit n=1 Tax=Rubrivirga litoralis TaxID=3075598 RepID=A0ABU3BTE3_9BACT|nr:efflux RND transporter periplasmic adaptor subunit [Rubrivirga sp. F394]MDT0632568.1 efflux RND transporter periplasmic adaptor subunit [Rubrivirga sp. F394]
MNRPLCILLFLLAAAPLAGCGSEFGAAPADDTDHEEHGDAEHDDGHSDDGHDSQDEIALTEAQAAAAGIETAAAQAGPLADELRVPARIIPTETGQAQVGALVDGRVVRLLAAEGQAVRRGAAVAAIESPEVARLQGEYLQAQARATQAEQQLARSRQLAAEDLISGTLLEQAVADARATEAQAAALAGEIRSHGGTAPSGPGGVTGRVTVASPIAGVVSARQAELGAFVQAAAPLYEVVAPGQVYADASVDPAAAAAIGQGDAAVIEAPGGRRYRGTVQFVGAEVAGETRTATVRLRVANATAELRPETFVTVAFEVEAPAGGAVTVPAEAVEREGGQAFVYVPVPGEPRTYARRAVALGGATGDRVEVTAGLEPGERVVVDGVFALKSFRSRGELSGHSH